MGATRAVFYLGQEAFLGSVEGFLLAAMVVWLVSEVACLKVGRGWDRAGPGGGGWPRGGGAAAAYKLGTRAALPVGATWPVGGLI